MSSLQPAFAYCVKVKQEKNIYIIKEKHKSRQSWQFDNCKCEMFDNKNLALLRP